MTAARLRHVLGILDSYPREGTTGSVDVSAEHDRIWIGGPAPADLSRADDAQLKEHGCYFDERNASWWVFT